MRKFLSAIIIAAMLLNPLSAATVKAQDYPTDSTPVPKEPSKRVEIVTTDTSEGNAFGYIPSHLDTNVPVYIEPFLKESATTIPSCYNANIAQMKANYPAVRDQNPYGTCWSFATTGVIEFNLIKDGVADKSIDLSELHLAYSTYNTTPDPLGGTSEDRTVYYEDTTDAHRICLDFGGNYEMSSRTLMKGLGPVPESAVPYSSALNVALNGYNPALAYGANAVYLKNVYVVDIVNNPNQVKKMIMDYGAIGISYCHDWDAINKNSNGDWTYYDDNSDGGGHAVMVVGWDDNYSKDNYPSGYRPGSNGAWLVRNSWDDGYADYVWMSYDTVSLRNGAWVFDATNTKSYDNNYQLDGAIYPSYWTVNTYANVFTAAPKTDVTSETLNSVSLSFTNFASVNYTVEVYTDLTDLSNPLSGTKQTAATTTGQTTYAGIYTVNLAQSVTINPGSSFAVVVTTSNGYLDVEDGLELGYYSSGVWNPVWESIADSSNGRTLYSNNNRLFNTFTYGNACIKAYTVNNTSPYVVDGVDYTPVFNPDYYYANNPDLAAAFGNDATALFNHFIAGGIYEGRQASEEFNLTLYKHNYPELVSEYGNDNRAYYLHYLTNGKEEGRVANKLVNLVIDGIDYSSVFDAEYYRNRNADLAACFGNNYIALFHHFVNTGINEGRYASPEFKLDLYKYNYSDLVTAFGSDNRAYFIHYITNGKAEGRIGGRLVNLVVDGIDYAPVFDAEFYRAVNPDLAACFGDNYIALFNHFVNGGINEGRQASKYFNVHRYKEYNTDLAAAFGHDFRSYFFHYLSAGRAEGRIATLNCVVDGLNYAIVFDPFFYYSAQTDCARVYGYDENALFDHFLRSGINEGRQANTDFNVYIYMNNNPDLVSVFGSNLKAYYHHYITSGKAEGRVAH